MHGTDTQFFFFITGDSVLAQGRGDVGLWEGGGYEGYHFLGGSKEGIFCCHNDSSMVAKGWCI